MPLHVSSTCTYHQEVKIALHSLWYHHTYRCDDTRGCVMQFWAPDGKHMCSKHVEAWNKLTVKKNCASSWLITEINILRCTVSKTSKFDWVLSINMPTNTCSYLRNAFLLCTQNVPDSATNKVSNFWLKQYIYFLIQFSVSSTNVTIKYWITLEET